MVSLFYNNMFGKILLLGLIVYYSNSNQELGFQIALLLTLLYIILLNINNTQNSITSYGKLINNNLIGGNVEEEEENIDDELLSSTEEDDIDKIIDETPNLKKMMKKLMKKLIK